MIFHIFICTKLLSLLFLKKRIIRAEVRRWARLPIHSSSRTSQSTSPRYTYYVLRHPQNGISVLWWCYNLMGEFSDFGKTTLQNAKAYWKKNCLLVNEITIDSELLRISRPCMCFRQDIFVFRLFWKIYRFSRPCGRLNLGIMLSFELNLYCLKPFSTNDSIKYGHIYLIDSSNHDSDLISTINI